MNIKHRGSGQSNGWKSVRHFPAIFVVMSAVLLLACSAEQQLPVGASLSISPQTRTLTISDRSNAEGNCLINPDYYIDWPIVLALTDSAGNPVGHQNVQVYLDFAANTYAGYPVMALYDDRRGNSNGVVDEFELVSDIDDQIVTVKTDVYGGDRPLLLRVNISCPFTGEVFAFVDGVSASSTIDIVADTDATLEGKYVEGGL